MPKIKIVVDADVLIHFSKAGCLYLLPRIFPEYGYTVLSPVYNETASVRAEIDRICHTFGTMTVEEFNPKGDMLREYTLLLRDFGRGESACMAYCRFTHNVVGSSNLRDIKQYCTDYGITYLTTLDFFYYAWKRNILTADQINQALRDIVSKKSKLPTTVIETYKPNVLI